MNKKKGTQTVVVTGDVTIDWNIARVQRGEGPAHAWNADDLTRVFCQPGGAAMSADLIKAVAKELGQSKQLDIEVHQVGVPSGRISPDDKRFHHSYAIWKPFASEDMKSKQKRKVWRVQEFLGLYPAITDPPSSSNLKKVLDEPENPDLMILDDAALGFRDHSKYWSQGLLHSTSRPWILLKMARPVAQGKLWDYLQKSHADRTIVIMTANDLRQSQVHISRQISWERTAQDVLWELLHNRLVKSITRFAHVIVSINTAGAILFSNKPRSAPVTLLFFDPTAMEGEWERRYEGNMIGYTSCLTAGIARELLLNAAKPDISGGIKSGIHAMRFLHTEGYGHFSSNPKLMNLRFPASDVATKLAERNSPVAVAQIRNPAIAASSEISMEATREAAHFWTILDDQIPDSLENISRQIVRGGLEQVLTEVPIGHFGKLKTVDRREIEALNSISSLICEYCQRHRTKPLSISVFGPPGAGKSFTVEQVVESALPGKIEALSFNLSQFDDPDDLIDALHQVRDKALSGKIPLVFWDEFDSMLQGQPLGWLRYFLAPMQDGEFQEGQIVHPIGQGIFVFAGGTSHSMEEFGTNPSDEDPRAVKLPDFVSRLKGFLNILGPNRQESEDAHGRTGDPYYIVRRAIILRSIFERYTPQLLRDDGGSRTIDIDLGLLRAFLLTKEYKHGARSMESIVSMSQLTGKTSFDRSSLPTEAQLNLHVDGREFYALMQAMELDSYLLEKLAEGVHEVFCADLRAKGYKYGPVTREKKKEHSSLRPYSELPKDEQEQNRGNARDIQNKLSSLGYRVVPDRGSEAPAKFADSDLEKLARVEHDRWMRQKTEAGWKWAAETKKTKKLHKDLKPWGDLSDKEQDKDRELVRGIPRILAKAGYTMVKLS